MENGAKRGSKINASEDDISAAPIKISLRSLFHE